MALCVGLAASVNLRTATVGHGGTMHMDSSSLASEITFLVELCSLHLRLGTTVVQKPEA